MASNIKRFVQCPYCGLACDDRQILIAHIIDRHIGFAVWIAWIVPWKTTVVQTSETEVTTEIVIDADTGLNESHVVYQCSKCDFGTIDEIALKTHLIYTHGFSEPLADMVVSNIVGYTNNPVSPGTVGEGSNVKNYDLGHLQNAYDVAADIGEDLKQGGKMFSWGLIGGIAIVVIGLVLFLVYVRK